MRIATSTVYDNQIASIDNLTVAYQNLGQELSTGKSLTQPSDDPLVIGQDLQLTGTIAKENGDVTNATAAQNELTYTDSTLSSLTDILQQARSITVASATDVIPNGSQRKDQAVQIEGLLEQAISLANAQYGNQYVFAGSGARATPPVVANGSPPDGTITFSGNLNANTLLINGQNVAVGTTLQQAFNYQSTDGTPSVFQLLANLRDTMNQEPAVDESGASINQSGQVIYDASAAPATPATTLGQLAANPPVSAIQLTPDNALSTPPGTSYYTITINGTDPATGLAASKTFTFTNTTPISDATASTAATANSVVGAINSSNVGVQAQWDVQSQRLILTSVNANATPFTITDSPTPAGATVISPVATAGPTTAASTTSNFLSVFNLQSQADVINNLSTQLGDIDRVLNNVLEARAQVGEQIQSVQSTATQLGGQTVDNTNTQSGYEDTNVAQATTQFSEVQTALQAAYAVTTRLEGKTLIDYL